MTSSPKTIGEYFSVIIIVLSIWGCSDSTGDPPPGADSHTSTFTATVSGAVKDEIAGAGIVTYLPPKERDPVTGRRPGYFLISNFKTDSDEQSILINFRIPDDTQPGQYTLLAPDPLKIGQNFDVSVETIKGEQLTFYQTNTEGTLHLDRFSPDRANPDTSTIKGTFQFVTENMDGNRISASGTFDFPIKKKVVVFRNSGYAWEKASDELGESLSWHFFPFG